MEVELLKTMGLTDGFNYPGEDAPQIQRGVCSEKADGYDSSTVHWAGSLARLAALGAGYLKLPKGWVFKRIAVKAKANALAKDVAVTIGAAAYTLVDANGDTIPVTRSTKLATDTESAVGGGASISGAIVYGPFDGSDSDSDADEGSATEGLVKDAAITPSTALDNEDTYLKITTSGTVTGDALVEVVAYGEVVAPEKMF
jgi:hypothetical protein